MKVSINKIINEVLELKDVKNIDRVKSLYIKLGNILSYDVKYLRLQDMDYLYNKVFTANSVELSNYKNKIDIICRPMAELLVESINKIADMRKDKNMKARMIGYEKNKQNHVVVLLTLGKRNYYLDLMKDLYKIQKNMRTKYFAPEEDVLINELKKYNSIQKELENIECTSIPRDKQEKIDEKIGYLDYKIYTDDVLEMLKKEMEEERENILEKIEETNLAKKENKIIKFKIDFIFKYFRNNYLEKDTLKVEELRKYYAKIFGDLLTKKEKDNINLRNIEVGLKNESNFEFVNAIIYELEFIKENKFFYYNYDLSKKGYSEKSEEELMKMKECGFLKYKNRYNVPQFEKDEVR